MSSLIRTIQKRIAKDQGFQRGPKVWDEEAGLFVTGPIINSGGEPVGQHWPKVKAPTRDPVARR